MTPTLCPICQSPLDEWDRDGAGSPHCSRCGWSEAAEKASEDEEDKEGDSSDAPLPFP